MADCAFPTSAAPVRMAPVQIGLLRLRPARNNDLDFLRGLYRSFRAEEMATVPWPQSVKDAFLDQQFRLQHQHFTTVFADADFLIVERAGSPVGRLYLQSSAEGVLVVDIGLLPESRRQGYGRLLMAWVIRRASSERAPKVWLHVLPQNTPARRLYERLGFVVVGEKEALMRMERLSAS
ncbi:MAG: GNAT family N-acetyltransferase [Brevundimonas sp.]